MEGNGMRLITIRSPKKTTSVLENVTTFFKCCLLFAFVVAASGCNNMIKRGQSPDDALMKVTEDTASTRYVSDLCRIYGLNFAKIEGIGLVRNLDGKGSNPAPSGQREHLYQELKSRGIEDPKKLLSDKDTSMVVLQGLLPPAIRKGERYDVEVKTLGKSNTTSLRHGYLVETRMRPMAKLGRSVKEGQVTGYCKGTVLVNSLFESRQDQPNEIRGWVLGGGVATEDRPIGLTLKTDHSVRTTTNIARAINRRFTTIDDSGRRGVATPKTDKVVELLIPDEYRHNIGRYMQIVMNLAVSEPDSERVNRLDLLDQQISDPASARQAALRLEGFGKEGVPALKRAIRHHDSEVKFHAAQALCYLGETDGISVLEDLAASEPAFRWHSLTALASMDDIEAGVSLSNLMNSESAETRYGAFRAMRARSPNDLLVRGEAKEDFFFHVVPCISKPMLHFSRSQRPEIVCFGEEQKVIDDFLFVKTGLTVKGIGDEKIRVTKFTRDGEVRKVCSTKIPDLIDALTEVGCDYTTLVGMFRQAKKNGNLDSRLVVNAVPKIKTGRIDGSDEHPMEQSDKYVAGPIPELFRSGNNAERQLRRVETPLTAEPKDTKNKGETLTRWSKIKDWTKWNR